jgi:outer membrane biosynthesis protein TonB
MDDKIAQLILDELFSSLENLETQTAAVLQFLKDKGGASIEQLAPYLEQAGRATSIKRRAARVRIDYLLSGITYPPKKAVEQDAAKDEKKSPQPTAEKPKAKARTKDEEPESGKQNETKTETQEVSKAEERSEEEAVAEARNGEKKQEKRSRINPGKSRRRNHQLPTKTHSAGTSYTEYRECAYIACS